MNDTFAQVNSGHSVTYQNNTYYEGETFYTTLTIANALVSIGSVTIITAPTPPDPTPTDEQKDDYLNGRLSANDPNTELLGIQERSFFDEISDTVASGIALEDLTNNPVTSSSINVYVSSINGNDLNDGLSPASPIKSLSKIIDIANTGTIIYLERNSVWEPDIELSGTDIIESATQTLVESGTTCLTISDITNSALKTCSINAYGGGAKPIIRGSIVAPDAAKLSDVQADTYKVVIEGQFNDSLHPFGSGLGANTYPSIKQDGVYLTRVVDKPSVTSGGFGFFYVEAVGNTYTYYFSTIGNVDPTTVELIFPFKSLVFNVDVQSVKNIKLIGGSSKDANGLNGGHIDGVDIDDSQVHNSILDKNILVENMIVNRASTDYGFAGVLFFSSDYALHKECRNFRMDSGKIYAGLYSHSAEGSGINRIVSDNIECNGDFTLAAIDLRDCANFYLSGHKHRGYFELGINVQMDLTNFNGGSAPSMMVCLMNSEILSTIEKGQNNLFVSMNDGANSYFIDNVITNLASFSRGGGTSGSATLDGTSITLKNFTVDMRGFYFHGIFRLQQFADAGAQAIDIIMENCHFCKPVILEGEQGFTNLEPYEVIDFDNDVLAQQSVNLVVSNCFFEKCLFRKGGVFLETAAQLAAEFPNVEESSIIYGLKSVDETSAENLVDGVTPGNWFTVGELIGPSSTWKEDPGNSSKYLLRIPAPDKDILVCYGFGSIPSGEKSLNFYWNSGTFNKGISISNSGSIQDPGSGGTLVYDDFKEAMAFFEEGYLVLSITKTNINDTDNCYWKYSAWDMGSDYIRTEFDQNGIPNKGSAYDGSYGYSKERKIIKQLS